MTPGLPVPLLWAEPLRTRVGAFEGAGTGDDETQAGDAVTANQAADGSERALAAVSGAAEDQLESELDVQVREADDAVTGGR